MARKSLVALFGGEGGYAKGICHGQGGHLKTTRNFQSRYY